jgi:hypothetical protein
MKITWVSHNCLSCNYDVINNTFYFFGGVTYKNKNKMQMVQRWNFFVGMHDF